MASPTRIRPNSRRLTAQDASFLYGESLNGPMHIGSLSYFEGEIPFEQAVEQVEQRLHLIPRYRQRLMFVPFNLGHATWEDDPNFKVTNHVFRHRLAPGTTEEGILEAAMAVHAPPLDRSKPLWEMHVFEGLPGRTVLLWKVHHCMVDGVSGIELTTVMFDFEAEAPPPAPPETAWAPAPLPAPGEAVSAALLDAAQASLDSVRRVQELFRSPAVLRERATLMGEATRSMMEMATRPIVAAPWNQGPVSQKRSLAWAEFAFGEFRGVRGALGGTVNDVVLAVLSEGAARYLAEHKVPTNGFPLRVGCPVNVRREGEAGALGNRVSMMFPVLPAEPMPAAARLDAVRRETERIKEAREPQGLELMTETSDSMPPPLMGFASGVAMAGMDAAAAMASLLPSPLASPARLAGQGVSFVATNVPGVQVPQYLAGRRMTATIGLIPLGGPLGYGVAIQSYNQQLYVGMMAEPRVMPDVGRMKAHVQAAFADLKEAALANSRPQST
jgi:WS/DGAT/MGAT family acyltransferase